LVSFIEDNGFYSSIYFFSVVALLMDRLCEFVKIGSGSLKLDTELYGKVWSKLLPIINLFFWYYNVACYYQYFFLYPGDIVKMRF